MGRSAVLKEFALPCGGSVEERAILPGCHAQPRLDEIERAEGQVDEKTLETLIAQRESLEMVIDFVSDDRRLSSSFISGARLSALPPPEPPAAAAEACSTWS